MAIVSFCENNFVHGVEELVDRIEEELDGASVEIEACLGFCGDCAMGPFALVDEEFLQAETVDDLYEMIKKGV
ncbi:uncharacterized protein YuzB (UPF0349 family) [Orenia metallireducens]|jgi:uncharacterized protein YuzB (UPF0349 family)|uniref:Uncharacterized protein YuzB, UPF0349 family n=1 Tax=Orenia metallireducens TaxID=1413210 RepID=A0A285HTK4_9FIRM|nr:DUF1450 domain-containing protein [Orenia metallireducens]PRX25098.1 uncharacterized protein YuzB (UPF0349 family) [Orenia metallireducens]SNY38146.1 Uncharacterized protein YuzB, UPF0349 family [Orenia metallireducens]